MKNIFLIISGIIIGFVLLNLANCNNPNENILPLTKSWEKAVPNQEIPEGLTSLSSKHCGECHQHHYKEWKLSTHAHAWTDMQF